MDIAAAKKRCEAATKGPWLRQKERDSAAPKGVIDAYDEEAEGYYTIATVHEPGDADEDFIIHARSDLPAALEVLEEIRKLHALHYPGCPDGRAGVCSLGEDLDHILSKEGK